MAVPNSSFSAEDSGNSSDNSESDDTAERMDKLSPWHETSEAPSSHPEEVEPEEEEEEEPDVTVTVAAASPLPAAAISECPSMLQESAEGVLKQSEEQEEQGAEPAVTSPHLDRVSLMCVPDRNQTSPSRTPPQLPVSSPPSAAEDPCPLLSSPRVKGRRAILRGTGSETPPTTPLRSPSPPESAVLSSSPRSLLKRQEEPMVILHCLPSQHLPPKSPSANSDTDSASEEELTPPTEEEQLLPQERSSPATKRKAAEEEEEERSGSFLRRKGAEKKLCPDGPTPSKPPPSPLRPDRRSNGSQKTEEEAFHPEEAQNKPAQELLVGGTNKEVEVHARTPPPAAEDPAPSKEAEPPMGPEALVCHEVDLDDPEEKEKPTSSAEHLLLMVREEQQVLPSLPLVVHSSHHVSQVQARPFLIAANPAPSEELVPGGGQMGDSSPGCEGSTSSSSTCLLSLQDRGKEGGSTSL